VKKPIFVRVFSFLNRYDMKKHVLFFVAAWAALSLHEGDEVNIAKGAECSFNGGQIIQISDL